MFTDGSIFYINYKDPRKPDDDLPLLVCFRLIGLLEISLECKEDNFRAGNMVFLEKLLQQIVVYLYERL
ncbi:hypothetical protein VNO80_04362 [Phaseolus coccineus]|uniref:Uncharacterized protein n=1 Tax=Phaseolus coccineus TaxID=3886 RepID=A0AAN9NXS1_PHACN